MFSQGFLCKVLHDLKFLLYYKKKKPTDKQTQKKQTTKSQASMAPAKKEIVTKEIKCRTAAKYRSTSLILKKRKKFFLINCEFVYSIIWQPC